MDEDAAFKERVHLRDLLGAGGGATSVGPLPSIGPLRTCGCRLGRPSSARHLSKASLAATPSAFTICAGVMRRVAPLVRLKEHEPTPLAFEMALEELCQWFGSGWGPKSEHDLRRIHLSEGLVSEEGVVRVDDVRLGVGAAPHLREGIGKDRIAEAGCQPA